MLVRRMGALRPSLRSWSMGLLLVVMLVVGRWTRLPTSEMAMLWPAAGVVVWWLLGERPRGQWVVDSSLLLAAVLLANVATGTSVAVGLAFAVVNLAHGYLGAWLLTRWHLDGRATRTAADPARLLGASAVAGLVSGLLSALAMVLLLNGAFDWSFAFVAIRNTTGTFLVLLLVFAIARPHRSRELLSGARSREWALALLMGAAAYVFVFGLTAGAPLAFAVLPLWVWVGTRLGLARASALSVGLGVMGVVLTLLGRGPFASIDPVSTRAMVLQGFLLVTTLTVTTLASLQEDRARTVEALGSARRSLAASIDASLIGTCVVVIDEQCAGHLLRPNPALRRLLCTEDPPGATTSGSASCGTRPAGSVCWLQYLHPDDAALVSDVMRDLANGTRSEWTAELAHRLRDESVVWAQVHLSRLPEDVTGREDEPDSREAPSSAVAAVSTPATQAHAAVAQFLDITERKDIEAQLTHLALHDDLTGLPNRVLLRDRIELALGVAGRSRTHVAVVFLDLDHFKSINDSLGHDAGDVVLETVAQRLRAVLRPNDTVARIGGDEFVVCCADVATRHEAEELSRRIVQAVAQPVWIEDRFVPVGVSAGLTVSRPGDSAASLLKQSDAAMYAAKSSGRGRVESFDKQLEAQAGRYLTLSGELRTAMDHGQFTLRYQPIVDIATGFITAVEALVRWDHPTRGLLAPRQWLDVAEDSDLIVELGAWVLEQAMLDASRVAETRRPLKVHINVSGRQLSQPGLVEQVIAALQQSTLPAHLVVLELTESRLLAVHNSLLTDFSRLHTLGVEIAVDDFGTGFISLTQLVLLPVDSLKIDRSFVTAAATDPRARAVIRGVLGMAKALGLHTVAEGIETPAHAQMLQSMGCLSGQGPFWSPPVTLDRLEDLLQTASAPGARTPAQRRALDLASLDDTTA